MPNKMEITPSILEKMEMAHKHDKLNEEHYGADNREILSGSQTS